MSPRPLMNSLLVAALASACSGTSPSVVDAGAVGRPPGIYSIPEQLAFTCVTPGCDTTLTARITVSGDRRVAIKRILLDGAAAADFTFDSSDRAPFIVGAGAGFDVNVHYLPTGAPIPGSVALHLTFTDASADESDQRIMPGELVVPLLRRLVGSPELSVTPATVSFGAVMSGSSKTASMHLKNTGFGNIALEVVAFDAGSTELDLSLPMVRSMLPDAGIDVPISWNPVAPSYLHTTVQIFTSAPEVPAVDVVVEGTSLSTPRLALEPQGAVDFGEVARTQSRKLPVLLVNQGGADLVVQSLRSTDVTGNLLATWADGGTLLLDGTASLSIAPLGRIPLNLVLKGGTPGELLSADGSDSQLVVSSDDPDHPQVVLTVLGTVTEPRLSANPTRINFGNVAPDGGFLPVPQGWVIDRQVQLKNTGYGTLTVKNITFVGGSSQLFGVVDKPTLPTQLKRNQQLAFDVEFRGETMAPASGSLSIETDDPITPFLEIPLAATVADCTLACPIANGTPSCSMGACTVGTCNSDWYDTDQSAQNGCECHEASVGQSASGGKDPGSFCATAAEMGTLVDSNATTTSFTGNIPTADDVDIIHFYAQDAAQIFSEAFHVRIRLDSSDPGIQMCVYRVGSGNPQGCSLANEVCPSDGSYDKPGAYGAEDGADFAIKVYRTAASVPACTSYTVFMSNG